MAKPDSYEEMVNMQLIYSQNRICQDKKYVWNGFSDKEKEGHFKAQDGKDIPIIKHRQYLMMIFLSLLFCIKSCQIPLVKKKKIMVKSILFILLMLLLLLYLLLFFTPR